MILPKQKEAELLKFERSPSGEIVLRLSDRKHGKRVVEKYTLEQMEKAFKAAYESRKIIV